MKRLFLCTIISVIIFIFPSGLGAEGIELRGSLREWVKAFTLSPNELSLAETRLNLELLSSLGENISFKVNSYYIYDSLNRKGIWDFQEAYIDYYSSFLDIRFGRQVISWGKADEMNPTDILNPQNITNINEDKRVRKIGQMALKTEWKFSDFILEAIWKLEFDNMKLPALNSRFAFFSVPGLEEFPDPEYPQNRIKDTEWAFKLSRTISQFDLSISYFDGWDNIATPVFIFDPALQQIQLDKLKFFRTKMIGADFAGSIGSVGIWGEAAYFIPNKENDPLVKNPYLQFVIGMDYTFSNNIKINVQYFQEINETESDKEIVSKLGLGMPLLQAVTFRLEKKFGEGEPHSIEVFGIYDVKDNGLLLQPKLSLSPFDSFGIEFGIILYFGEEGSLFGRFANNDQIYVRSTISF